jgi:hypothetical protein
MRTSGRDPKSSWRITFDRLGRSKMHPNNVGAMKMSVYFFTPAILLGALTLGFGCPSKTTNVAGPTSASGSVSVLSVGPDPLTLAVGKSKQLNAVATLADGAKKDVAADANTHWTTDNPKTATVDEKGTVVGVSMGITKVTAQYGGASSSTTVTVTP